MLVAWTTPAKVSVGVWRNLGLRWGYYAPRWRLFVNATRAAVAEGIVPGGGTALLNCITAIEKLKLDGDERVGSMIVRRAIEAPLRQIAENAGKDGAVVVQKQLRGWRR